MIRPATAADLAQIEDAYNEHFAFEAAHPDKAFTVFRQGVYPTRRDAEKALASGGLTVYEEAGEILASVITSQVQPPEYADVPWQRDLADCEVRVIHLLMVRPGVSGRGIGTALLAHLEAQARAEGLAAIRLDTGSQNLPAVHLYEKNGYRIVHRAAMKVGGVVPHEGHLFLEKCL